jgi:hypothetical protein
MVKDNLLLYFKKQKNPILGCKNWNVNYFIFKFNNFELKIRIFLIINLPLHKMN